MINWLGVQAELVMRSSFTDIIRCTDKNELKKRCKSARLTMSEFVGFIAACGMGITHLKHIMHCADSVPPELKETEDDWKVLRAGPEVHSSKEGQKAIQRLFKTHGKRKYQVGHMFLSKESSNPISEWHFIFYELKELHPRNSHWEAGSHIHLTNYLWPNLNCQDVWNQFVSANEFPKSKLHVSCLDENRMDA